MNEQKQSKVKRIALGMALVLTMGASVTSLVMGVKHNGWFAPNDQVEEELQNDKTDVNVKANGINYMSLRMSDEAVVRVSESGVKTVSKTITATVLPADAPDKSVDWSIEWCVPLEDADVGDYLTVTPDSDGSLSATITAHNGFEGATACVTATTRVGGFSAICMVRYDGAPESLSFIYNDQEISNTGSLTLTAGTTNEISLNLKNVLGAVGSKYGDFEIVSVTGTGMFVMEKQYLTNGTVNSTEDIVFNLEHGSYSYTNTVTGGSQTLTITPDEFLTASVSGDVLKINAIKSVSAYRSPFPRTGYYFKYKGTYKNPLLGGSVSQCFWSIIVKDKVSEKEALIRVNIESSVNSVALSDMIVTF